MIFERKRNYESINQQLFDQSSLAYEILFMCNGSSMAVLFDAFCENY